MVIAVHTSQAFSDLPNSLSKILSQGARGVQLFFVTSALTLSLSWVARNESAANFYTRRFFRIAPMFSIAIVFFLWLNGTAASIYAPEGIGVRQVLMTVLFVHGFWPDTITSVVPGGWSVADEVIFYALFPLIVPPLLQGELAIIVHDRDRGHCYCSPFAGTFRKLFASPAGVRRRYRESISRCGFHANCHVLFLASCSLGCRLRGARCRCRLRDIHAS